MDDTVKQVIRQLCEHSWTFNGFTLRKQGGWSKYKCVTCGINSEDVPGVIIVNPTWPRYFNKCEKDKHQLVIIQTRVENNGIEYNFTGCEICGNTYWEDEDEAKLSGYSLREEDK